LFGLVADDVCEGVFGEFTREMGLVAGPIAEGASEVVRGVERLEAPRLCPLTDRDDVVLACGERIQTVSNHLQRLGYLRAVARLIVTGVQAPADASMAEHSRDNMWRMPKITSKCRAGPPQCVRRDFEPQPLFLAG
jgi:hypothetical protein